MTLATGDGLPGQVSPLRARAVRIGSIAGSFGLLFGFSTAVIAGVLDDVTTAYTLTTAQTELMVAALVSGAFVGASLGGTVALRVGRTNALLLSSFLALAGYGLILGGSALQSLGFIAFVVARIVIGLSVGLSSTVAPMYVAETTAARHRGSLVALFQLAVTAGILLAYTATWALRSVLSWEDVVGGGLLLSLFCMAATLAVPESPRWHLRAGDAKRAWRIAARLGLTDELMQVGSGPDRAILAGNLLQHLWRGRTVAVLALSGLLFIIQNLSGIDGILYYAPRIFVALGFSGATAALAATVGLGVVNFGATVAALLLVDRIGRRPLLIWGSVAMATGLAGVMFASSQELPWLGLAGLCIYLSAFAVSLGPLPYVLMSELVPSTIRDAGIAAASATSWLFNALVAFTFLTVVEELGLTWTFAGCTLICVTSALVAIRFVPETRGAVLERIEAHVLAGARLRDLANQK